MPFETLLLNLTEIINEVTVLLVAYHLFCFSDFVTSPDDEVKVGWSLIFLILANILFNTVVFIYMVVRSAILYVRRCKARKAAKNSAAKIKQQKEGAAQKLKEEGSKYLVQDGIIQGTT